MDGIPPGFQVAAVEYQHPSMGRVNQLLRGNSIIKKTAEQISTKVGKPWYESTFTTVRTGEKQYPAVYEVGAIAAQRVGIRRMPNLYIEMGRAYQSATFGSEMDAFINVGSFIPRLLNHKELLFVIGHEYGHLLASHALWMTVRTFLVGEKKDSLMSNGIITLLDISKWLESGVEALFTSWLQVADFTADRLGLLVTGDFELARKALFLLYLKSRREADELDIEAWAKEQEAQASTMSKMSQFTSSTPYLSVRLRELREFYNSPQYSALRHKIESRSGISLEGLFDNKGMLQKFSKHPGPVKAASSQSPPATSGGENPQIRVPTRKAIKGNCPHCKAGLALPLNDLPRQETVQITCAACQRQFSLNLARILGPDHLETAPAQEEPGLGRLFPKNTDPCVTGTKPSDQRDETGVSQKRPAAPETLGPPVERPAANNGMTMKVLKGVCPGCAAPFAIPFDKVPARPSVQVRCKACGKVFSLVLGKLGMPKEKRGGTILKG